MSELSFDMNRLTLKALMLSVITEIKYGEPLSSNAGGIKRAYKHMAGLPPRCSNKLLLKDIGRTYEENKMLDDYLRVLHRFGMQWEDLMNVNK